VFVRVPVVYDAFPDNKGVPPVKAEYQSIVAPVDAVAVTVEVLPLQIVLLLVDVIVGTGLTVTMTAVLELLRQPIVIFLASAKYVVVDDRVPVVYEEFPDNKGVPPVKAEYQSIVAPVDAVAVIVAELPLQIVLILVDVTVGNGLTATMTAVRELLTHPVVIFLGSA
jgi:hypothetical protein